MCLILDHVSEKRTIQGCYWCEQHVIFERRILLLIMRLKPTLTIVNLCLVLPSKIQPSERLTLIITPAIGC